MAKLDSGWGGHQRVNELHPKCHHRTKASNQTFGRGTDQ